MPPGLLFQPQEVQRVMLVVRQSCLHSSKLLVMPSRGARGQPAADGHAPYM